MKIKSLLVAGILIVSLSLGSIASAATETTTPENKVNQNGCNHQTNKHMAHAHHHKGWLDSAAKILKTDKESLLKELKSGKSLADVAKEKGVTEDQLKTGLQASFKEKLDEAIKSGKLTTAERDAMMAKSNERIDAFIHHKGLMKRHGSHFWLRDTAAILKMDPQALWKELESGKSLAEVAKEKGIDRTTLKQSLISSQEKRLDMAVKEGKLTEAQKQEIVKKMKSHIDEWIDKKDFGKAED